MMKRLIAVLAAPALCLCVQAEPFFQASLTPDIAIHSRDTTIKGITLSVWGENPQGSFALGFVNGSTAESGGFSLGLFNYSDTYTGVQWAFVNYSKERFVGWQDGFLNVANEFTGVQSGCVNVADKMSGLQWGFVNYTRELEGVQLGLANIVTTSPWFKEFPSKLTPAFVFVNWSF